MNSEELEVSLRSEFESYLKDVFGEMKQEIAEFQEKLDAEFEKHRSGIDSALEGLTARFSEDREFKASFTESVTEHLKLARDEGAKITAAAMAEAEQLRAEEESQEGQDTRFEDLRDAIDEISRKKTQSEILKSLVHHAANYTPRGAFFIVKNEHLVGWRVFGQEEHPDPEVVREVFFPLSAKTALGVAVDTLATVEGIGDAYEDGERYLDALGFSQTGNLFALPLVARDRGVAVLCADGGEENGDVNIEALESLMCVAGLTVELLASAPSARPVAPAYAVEESAPAEERLDTDHVGDELAHEEPAEGPESLSAEEEAGFEESGFDAAQDTDELEPVGEEVDSAEEEVGFVPVYSDSADETPEAEKEISGDDFAAAFEPDEELREEETADADAEFDSGAEDTYEVSDAVELTEEAETQEEFDDVEAVEVEESSGETPAVYDDEYLSEAPAEDGSDLSEGYDEITEVSDEYYEEDAAPVAFEEPASAYEAEESPAEVEEPEDQAEEIDIESPAPEPAVAETVAPVRSRLAKRNVDLPIDVSEDERLLHNDARRFARLLVSEIKLYNEQKVKEGREAKDLYERLKEAIDRSREMYDKRVQPPVASKFDYFNYELVNTLADGDEANLGGSYPGAAV